MRNRIAFLLIPCLFFAGCSVSNDLVPEPSSFAPQTTLPPKQASAIPSATLAPEIGITEGSLEPIEITFPSMDGEMLSGTYYPPAAQHAPLVVLMHQYNLNQYQWDAIALWLQNAPGEKITKSTASSPWLDASWFPALPQDFSVGVFTFTFRDCEKGCGKHLPAEWLLDAEAAMGQAATMPGIDVTTIIPIGTSIGADAAVDACLQTAPRSSIRCAGAMSLSPGSYLEKDYQQTVQQLLELGVPVTCFASEKDGPSAAACQSIIQEGYTFFVDPGLAHGIMMVDPEQKTNVLSEIYKFISTVRGF